MILRDAPSGGIEVYMARRSAKSAFMPDAYVFPGGAVEQQDHDERLTAAIDGLPRGIGRPAVVAAIREAFEEAGVLFALRADGMRLSGSDVAAARASFTGAFATMVVDHGWTLTASAFVYYSHWITPPIDVARRFDTRFFAAPMPAGQAAVHDAVEMHDGVWTTPQRALFRAADGKWTVAFPTTRHLERLANFSSVEAFFRHARTRTPAPTMPDVGTDGTIVLRQGADEW